MRLCRPAKLLLHLIRQQLERQLQEDVLRNLKEQTQVMAIMQAQADARLMYAGRAPSRSANGLLETYF